MIMLLIVHLSTLDLGGREIVDLAGMDLLAALTLLQAMSMVLHGPRSHAAPDASLSVRRAMLGS